MTDKKSEILSNHLYFFLIIIKIIVIKSESLRNRDCITMKSRVNHGDKNRQKNLEVTFVVHFDPQIARCEYIMKLHLQWFISWLFQFQFIYSQRDSYDFLIVFYFYFIYSQCDLSDLFVVFYAYFIYSHRNLRAIFYVYFMYLHHDLCDLFRDI